jgi:hypothetical protein
MLPTEHFGEPSAEPTKVVSTPIEDAAEPSAEPSQDPSIELTAEPSIPPTSMPSQVQEPQPTSMPTSFNPNPNLISEPSSQPTTFFNCARNFSDSENRVVSQRTVLLSVTQPVEGMTVEAFEDVRVRLVFRQTVVIAADYDLPVDNISIFCVEEVIAENSFRRTTSTTSSIQVDYEIQFSVVNTSVPEEEAAEIVKTNIIDSIASGNFNVLLRTLAAQNNVSDAFGDVIVEEPPEFVELLPSYDNDTGNNADLVFGLFGAFGGFALIVLAVLVRKRYYSIRRKTKSEPSRLQSRVMTVLPAPIASAIFQRGNSSTKCSRQTSLHGSENSLDREGIDEAEAQPAAPPALQPAAQFSRLLGQAKNVQKASTGRVDSQTIYPLQELDGGFREHQTLTFDELDVEPALQVKLKRLPVHLMEIKKHQSVYVGDTERKVLPQLRSTQSRQGIGQRSGVQSPALPKISRNVTAEDSEWRRGSQGSIGSLEEGLRGMKSEMPAHEISSVNRLLMLSKDVTQTPHSTAGGSAPNSPRMFSGNSSWDVAGRPRGERRMVWESISSEQRMSNGSDSRQQSYVKERGPNSPRNNLMNDRKPSSATSEPKRTTSNPRVSNFTAISAIPRSQSTNSMQDGNPSKESSSRSRTERRMVENRSQNSESQY